MWCTGFGGDFSWLDPALVDPTGQPTDSGCAAAVPGIWYVGLRWLTHRGSAALDGFPTDAATVADAVRTQLNGSDRTRPTTRLPRSGLLVSERVGARLGCQRRCSVRPAKNRSISGQTRVPPDSPFHSRRTTVTSAKQSSIGTIQ